MKALFLGTDGVEVLPPLDLADAVIDRPWLHIERPFLAPEDLWPQRYDDETEFLTMRFRRDGLLGPEDGGPAVIYRVC